MRSKRKITSKDNLKKVSDFARMAAGTLGSFDSIRPTVKALIKDGVEKFASEMDMVTREEFTRVQKLAERARDRQEDLEDRVKELEALVTKPKKKTVKKTVKKKAAKKKTIKRKKK